MKRINRVREIESQLSEFVEAAVDEDLRKELHEIYIAGYEMKLSNGQYFTFILENIDCFHIDKVPCQNTNRPCYLCMFTIKYQHVYGNSLGHLIDNALGLNDGGD